MEKELEFVDEVLDFYTAGDRERLGPVDVEHRKFGPIMSQGCCYPVGIAQRQDSARTDPDEAHREHDDRTAGEDTGLHSQVVMHP